MAYVDDARRILLAKLDDKEQDYSDDGPMLDLYTLLVLTLGERTTLREVHDACAIAYSHTKPDAQSLVPFDELPEFVREWDRPYVEAIQQAAAELKERA